MKIIQVSSTCIKVTAKNNFAFFTEIRKLFTESDKAINAVFVTAVNKRNKRKCRR